MTDDGLDRCGVKGCPVVRDPKARVPQPTFSCVAWIKNRPGGYCKPLCQAHYGQALEVERDLPLAIQELHALALLYQQSPGAPPLGPNIVTLIAMAVARVGRLRALEALLKGGE
jgi:hypothetical protein